MVKKGQAKHSLNPTDAFRKEQRKKVRTLLPRGSSCNLACTPLVRKTMSTSPQLNSVLLTSPRCIFMHFNVAQELNKNKKERLKVREVALTYKDPDKIRTQVRAE